MKTIVLATLVLTASTAFAEVSIVDNNKKLTVDCAKDREVNLIGNNISVTLVGTCKLITVTGNNATVSGSGEKFYIAGNSNTVAANAADEIHIAGNKNTVSWRKGASKPSPKISNPGKDNKVTQQR
jgi:hypothetical protein